MKSFLPTIDEDEGTPGAGTMEPWEAVIVDAVGSVIDFWQFKRNQGRVWAILFLRHKAMTAHDLQETLGLSKGAVSMLVRDLEQWGVIRRVRAPHDTNWRYEAETDLLGMVRRVIGARELSLVARVRHDLVNAEALAAQAGAPPDMLKRITTMRRLAVLMEKGIEIFIKTARLDLVEALGILQLNK